MSEHLDPGPTVYVSAAGSGEILVFRVPEADGQLQLIQQLRLGGALMPMAWNPDRLRLYVVGRSEPYAVHTLAAHPDTGMLSPMASTAITGNMAFVSTSLDGRFLLTASYGDHHVTVNPIDGDGVVQAEQQVVATPKHAHAIRPAPDGQSVWVACLGDNVLVNHRFNTNTGHLDTPAHRTKACRDNSGPRHFVFHPNGQLLFLINELDGTVDSYALLNGGQDLQLAHSTSMVTSGQTESPWAAELRLNAEGTLLFASDRRSHTVTSFRVDAQHGQLQVADCIQTEALPRSLAVSRNGRWLFVAGQQSGHLALIQVDTASGRMATLSRHACGTSPTWVEA